MATQKELDGCYMDVAIAHAKLSKGIRAKVGAAIVTKTGVILGGCNGLSSGGDNVLEDKVYATSNVPLFLIGRFPHEDENGIYNLVTKPHVIHAETNAILKAAREGVSVIDSTLYVTLSPCLSCSEMILAAGIKRVVYLEDYRCSQGIDNLKGKIEVVKL